MGGLYNSPARVDYLTRPLVYGGDLCSIVEGIPPAPTEYVVMVISGEDWDDDLGGIQLVFSTGRLPQGWQPSPNYNRPTMLKLVIDSPGSAGALPMPLEAVPQIP